MTGSRSAEANHLVPCHAVWYEYRLHAKDRSACALWSFKTELDTYRNFQHICS